MSQIVSQKLAASPRVRLTKWVRELGWRYLVGLTILAFGLFPVVYVVSASINPIGSIASTKLIPASITLDHYRDLVAGGHPFVFWYRNTLLVSLSVAIGQVCCSALAAFSFSRLRFAGRRAGLLAVLLIQMFPQFLAAIALYTMVAQLGDIWPQVGLDTVAGYGLVLMGGAMTHIWLIKGFMDSIPRDLDDAARIDGAGHFRIFTTILLPLVRPVLAVTFLLSFVSIVGEFMLASVFLTSDKSKTLAVGLFGIITDNQSNNMGLFAAGSVLIAVPVVVLFMYLQRFITSGLATGAVK